jgi:hypothetical protein
MDAKWNFAGSKGERSQMEFGNEGKQQDLKRPYGTRIFVREKPVAKATGYFQSALRASKQRAITHGIDIFKEHPKCNLETEVGAMELRDNCVPKWSLGTRDS